MNQPIAISKANSVPFKLKTNIKAGIKSLRDDGVDPDSPQSISFDNEFVSS